MKTIDSKFLDKISEVLDISLDDSQRGALIGNVSDYQNYLKQGHPVTIMTVKVLRALLANEPVIYQEDLSPRLCSIAFQWSDKLNRAGIQTKAIHTKDYWRHTEDVK